MLVRNVNRSADQVVSTYSLLNSQPEDLIFAKDLRQGRQTAGPHSTSLRAGFRLHWEQKTLPITLRMTVLILIYQKLKEDLYVDTS